MSHDLLLDLAKAVVSQDARQYAISTGWRRLALQVRDTPSFFGRVAAFERPENPDEQILIPLDDRTSDYDRRMAEATLAIARWEGRPAAQVANDLLNASSDLLRFRVASPSLDAGSLPLEDGLSLLSGAKTAILAAAHSVLSPSRYHKRMSKAEADELLRACRMGQTERGSFIATVACPLRAVEANQPLFETREDPFARKTTFLLMKSLGDLVNAIEGDTVQDMVERNEENPLISANLCDAVSKMKPSIEGADLTVSATWSPLRAINAAARAPSTVRIQHSYFPIIDDIYRELRPDPAPQVDTFVGFVDTLDGRPGPTGQVEGDVILRVLVDDENLIRAKATLSAEQHAVAVEAYQHQHIIRIDGNLSRRSRLGIIDNPANFQIIRDVANPAPPAAEI